MHRFKDYQTTVRDDRLLRFTHEGVQFFVWAEFEKHGVRIRVRAPESVVIDRMTLDQLPDLDDNSVDNSMTETGPGRSPPPE